jgi:preprotein translocase subunit YajC
MGNSPYSTLVLIALMAVAFYFLIIRPNKKRQQAQLETMRSLAPGTRVLTTSGLFGRIVEIGEKQAVLEISPGAHLTVLKQAIARVVQPTDEDTEWESIDDEPADDDEISASGTSPATDTMIGTAPGTTLTNGTPTSGSHPNNNGSTGSSAVHHEVTEAGTQAPSPWSSNNSLAGRDQDPRSGTSTTPTKD